jgi:hypothetical protein
MKALAAGVPLVCIPMGHDQKDGEAVGAAHTGLRHATRLVRPRRGAPVRAVPAAGGGAGRRVTAQLGIDCDLDRVPAFTYVESSDGLDECRGRRRGRGGAGRVVRHRVRPAFPGRRRDPGGRPSAVPPAQVPARAGRGPDPARRPDLRTDRAVGRDEGDPCTVVTQGGHTITARQVVVATHYPVCHCRTPCLARR